MDLKRFWKESLPGFIIKRILLALLIIVVLSWSTLILIDVYTRHGESVPVPDLRGLYVEEANNILQNNELYSLVIDSVYVREKALGTIIDQIPPAGSSVKKNRSIFLIVNKKQFRKIPLPDVNDISYRQADALLRSLGLRISNVIYSPSEFKDLVIDVLYNGKSIEPGTRLSEGSSVVLMVGSGMGNNVAQVPSLVGLTLAQAKELAIASSFVIGGVNFDEAPGANEGKFLIFKQQPLGGQGEPVGSRIDVWLTRDQDIINESIRNQPDNNEEETFF
jgi:beta-lactam-binding protein with PASTA domain